MKDPLEVCAPESIRRRRISYGWSVEDLADVVGMGAGEVLLLELGRLPSIAPDAWVAIVSALRLATDPTALAPPLADRRRGSALRTLPRSQMAGVRTAPKLSGWQASPLAPWWLRLRIQRVALGLTQLELAQFGSAGVSAVRELEAGAYPLTPTRREAVRLIAGALRLDLPMPRESDADPASPGESMRVRRTENRWGLARTAAAIGCAPQALSLAEAARAWPLSPSPAMTGSLNLWRIGSLDAPRHVESWTHGEREQAVRVIADRFCALVDQWGLSDAEVSYASGVSPVQQQMVRRGRNGTGSLWRAVGALTNAGFDLVKGLAIRTS